MARKIKIYVIDKNSSLREVSILRRNLVNYRPVSRVSARGKLIYVKRKGKVISRYGEKRKRIKKKGVGVPKEVKVTAEEEVFIKKIKRGAGAVDLEAERGAERRLLKEVRLLPRFDKFKFIKRVDGRKGVISDGKTYSSFAQFDSSKRDIYMNLMNRLVASKDKRFEKKMYALRRELLKDGIVIEVDIYGALSQKSMRRVYMGTVAMVGLMVEDAGFIESDLIGWSGENRLLEAFLNAMTRNSGGEKCYWIRNNLSMDTVNIIVTDVNLRLNYA